jgi:hypothetical protein
MEVAVISGRKMNIGSMEMSIRIHGCCIGKVKYQGSLFKGSNN